MHIGYVFVTHNCCMQCLWGNTESASADCRHHLKSVCCMLSSKTVQFGQATLECSRSYKSQYCNCVSVDREGLLKYTADIVTAIQTLDAINNYIPAAQSSPFQTRHNFEHRHLHYIFRVYGAQSRALRSSAWRVAHGDFKERAPHLLAWSICGLFVAFFGFSKLSFKLLLLLLRDLLSHFSQCQSLQCA